MGAEAAAGEMSSMTDYLALRAFSGGLAARILNDSPFHAWYQSPWNPDFRGGKSRPSDIGTSAHAILLEGDESVIAVINPEDNRSKPTKSDPEGSIPTGWTNGAMRASRDAAYVEGKTPILPGELAALRNMVETAKNYVAASEIAGIFDTGEPEVTLGWTDKGVLCKARPDWLSGDRRICLSYKTTLGSANPRQWSRTQLPQYEIGMALYERGIRSVYGVERTRVVHLIQEQKPPYACSLVALAPSRQDLAERQLDTALAIWRECLETKRFPAYPRRICYAEVVAWQAQAFEEQHGESAEDAEIGETFERMEP